MEQKDKEIEDLTLARDEANQTIIKCGFDRALQRISELEQDNAKLIAMLEEALLDEPGIQMDISEFLKNRIKQ